MGRIITVYNPIYLTDEISDISDISMSVLLCQCVEKYDLPMMESVRYIEMSGGILSDEVRKWTKRVFGNCNIANQYGANELQ